MSLWREEIRENSSQRRRGRIRPLREKSIPLTWRLEMENCINQWSVVSGRWSEKSARQASHPHDSIKKEKRFGKLHGCNIVRAGRQHQAPDIFPAVAPPFA